MMFGNAGIYFYKDPVEIHHLYQTIQSNILWKR